MRSRGDEQRIDNIINNIKSFSNPNIPWSIITYPSFHISMPILKIKKSKNKIKKIKNTLPKNINLGRGLFLKNSNFYIGIELINISP